MSFCTLPELLAPAGNLEKLKTAVLYGADAVYLGAKQHSLRARAANFSEADLYAGVTFAHEHGVKVYATVNIFAHNADLPGLADTLVLMRDAEVDACIVADPGVLRLARQLAPELPLHLSTQMNVTNREHAAFWAEQGLARLNLARELSLAEIREIRAAVSCGLEVFVHGAICISYSGRCLLSTYFTGRDANRGDCAQPCRYSYALVEEKRPGQYFPIEEDGRGAYVFNSRDLCLLPHLPRLVAAGVDALKIEGRMKSAGYVAQTVHLYRQALDWIAAQTGEDADRADLERLTLPAAFLEELSAIGTRGHTDNFFVDAPDATAMLHQSTRLEQSAVPAGFVRQTTPLTLETRSAFAVGDTLECLLPERFAPQTLRVTRLLAADPKDAASGESAELTQTRPNQLVVLESEPPLLGLQPGTLLRKRATPPCAA